MGEAKRKQKAPGTCYLCGGTGLTKQHMWPNWARSHLHRPNHHTRQFSFNRTLPVDDGRGGVSVRVAELEGKPQQGQISQSTQRRFCESCNTVWMRATIEEPARVFAEPLMRGETILLDEHAQTVLARWLTLVLIVVESGDAESASLTEPMLRQFRDDAHPLDMLQIYIAPLQGDRWRCSLWHQAFKIGADRNNTQVTTIGMGQFLVYIFSTENPNVTIDTPPYMAKIWPYTDTIAWPLSHVWSDDEAERLSRFFYNELLRMPLWRPGR